MKEKFVIDTSSIIHGVLREFVEKEKNIEIIIPVAVIDELQAQASKGREPGFIGLEEIKKVREIAEKKKIKISFVGERPTLEEIKLARSGRIDALIRDVAKKENATLLTGDFVQALVAEAEGVKVKHIPHPVKLEGLEFEKFFTNDTMSIHLKEGVAPLAKRGTPGNFKLVKIREEPLDKKELEKIIKEILEATRISESASVEIVRNGATVIQFGNYRISIAQPPFSDGLELTVVRPLVKLSLEDYKLSEKLMKRLKERAEGILIAGPPGSGKCVYSEELIYSNDGIPIKAKEITVGEKVLCLERNGYIGISRVKRVFFRKESTLFKIETRTGRIIRVTKEHPFLVIRDGIPKWIPASELKVGERIACIRKIPFFGKPQEIDWINLLDENKIWVRLNRHLNYKIGIEEKYLGKKRDILSFLSRNPKSTSLVISKNIKSHIRHTQVCLRELIKDGVVRRSRAGNKYFYEIVKKFWEPKENDIIPLKVFKQIIREMKLKKSEIKNCVKSILKRDLWHTSAEIKPVWKLTPEIAEILGYFIAERDRRIGICTDTTIARERFKELMENVFGLELKENEEKFTVYSDKYATLNELFTKCFNIVDVKDRRKASKATVPKLIFNSTNEIVSAFLRAFFSVESSIDIKKGCIEVISASKDLIADLARLLLRFGIISKVYSKFVNNKEYFKLEIYGNKNRKLFYENIGFIDPDKLDALLISLNKSGPRAFDLIPAGNLLILINKFLKLGFDSYDLKKNYYSPERLENFLRLIESKITPEVSLSVILAYELLKFMNSEYLFWDKIKTIERLSGDFEVYDFEIENSHNFIAGNLPILIHNSTLASSLAEFYKEQGKIVKTLESPKDLQVGPEITQYGPLEGDFEKTADILLLVRPDYSVYDEVRKTRDFEIFSDLRLAGVGMIGVVHSADAIGALQRFIGRVELGMIPHVIDTIIFVKDGEVKQVLELNIVVKVPTGMTEEDLARPVVEVRDFETGELVYEIYTFGEENVIVPIDKKLMKHPLRKLAAERILEEIKRFDPNAKVEIVNDNKAIVKVDNRIIPRIIGRDGETIKKIEDRLGIRIEVEPRIPSLGKEVYFRIDESGNSINFSFDKSLIGRIANIYLDEEFLFSATIGKKASIKVSKDSDIGRELIKAIVSKKKIKVIV
jgi:predicted PilT family ATPase/intein/homing endonuclease